MADCGSRNPQAAFSQWNAPELGHRFLVLFVGLCRVGPEHYTEPVRFGPVIDAVRYKIELARRDAHLLFRCPSITGVDVDSPMRTVGRVLHIGESAIPAIALGVLRFNGNYPSGFEHKIELRIQLLTELLTGGHLAGKADGPWEQTGLFVGGSLRGAVRTP